MSDHIDVNLPYITGKKAYLYKYDGVDDDLLSAGLGFEGLRSPEPPGFKDDLNPSHREIRRRTIYFNYRAILDMSPEYYGKYYGPGIRGSVELIAGEEYIGITDEKVTLMVQIPDSFDRNNPVIVTAPSSGSRGIYGAIGPVGEWALQRGFAVAYTDKGTGIGIHNLEADTVNGFSGKRKKADDAGEYSNFTAPDSKEEIEKYLNEYPGRIASKHAHSQNNQQKDWGKNVLQSIEFAFYILRDKFGERRVKGIHEYVINRDNIKVIASGISNGGGASLRAAEQDREEWIDAVVVSEPNVTPEYNSSFSIRYGNNKPVQNHSKHLIDYITLLNVYQPAASLSPDVEQAPMRIGFGGVTEDMCRARCISLKEKGLLKGDSVSDMAKDAVRTIRECGIICEQDLLQPSHYNLDIARSISFTYANQYGRFSVTDNLCGFSFTAISDEFMPRLLTNEEERVLFSDQAGIPPLGSVQLINNESPVGAVEDRRSVSKSTGRNDMNLDGALKLRRLITGSDEKGAPLTGKELEKHKRIREGMREVETTCDIRGLPAIIVNGRSDAVLQVNHTSRAYVGCNMLKKGEKSNLKYYEITNAHHLDALNILYANEKYCTPALYYTPLHVYLVRALDLMFQHLKGAGILPESQVVRADSPKEILPDIEDDPGMNNIISFEDGELIIPE